MSPMKWQGCIELIGSSNGGSILVAQSQEVNPSISRSETTVDGVREVRQVHSSDEVTVMVTDAKGPDFCCASFEEQGDHSLQKRSSKWA